FSSRRRHTRLQGDWSSDVCSSDLGPALILMGKDGSIPTERAARVRVPTLVINGGNGAPFMRETAKTLSKAIPGAELRTLDSQTRSEERRVGKEWRCRWARECGKER